MEIIGKMYKILPVEEVSFEDGTKKMKGGFVIKRLDDYQIPVFFELFGDEKIAVLKSYALDALVRVVFYAESREGKNGKYYTSLRCTNISGLETKQPGERQPIDEPPIQAPEPPIQASEPPILMDDDKELPF